MDKVEQRGKEAGVSSKSTERLLRKVKNGGIVEACEKGKGISIGWYVGVSF